MPCCSAIRNGRPRYIPDMVADHKKDISEYDQAAKKKDAIGQYAEST